MWQLLAWLNSVVIPGLRAGTCAVMRGRLLIVCMCVCHLSNKELLLGPTLLYFQTSVLIIAVMAIMDISVDKKY